MSEHIKNIPASIHARLAREARNLGKPFNELLQNYGMERFLYRLSKTEYADNFILKGGLIFTVWNIRLRRPTRDIDLLGSLDSRKETITQVLQAAIAIPMFEDGLSFEDKTIKVEEKQVDADRVGISVNLLGYLGKAEIPIHIDIGFSDEVSYSLEDINYPTILNGMVGPVLRGYPPEYVISEKLHAMDRFSETPSRWKDYYDVWLISEHFELDILALQKAITTTFKNRNTKIPTERPVYLTIEFAAKHRDGWNSFLKKNDLENNMAGDLSLVIEKIWQFLECPLIKTTTQHECKTWNPNKRQWE